MSNLSWVDEVRAIGRNIEFVSTKAIKALSMIGDSLDGFIAYAELVNECLALGATPEELNQYNHAWLRQWLLLGRPQWALDTNLSTDAMWYIYKFSVSPLLPKIRLHLPFRPVKRRRRYKEWQQRIYFWR